MSKKVRILGLDPGIVNFGVAVIELNKATGKCKILHTYMLDNPIYSIIDDFSYQRRAFLSEINALVQDYKIDGFIAERFQSRGLKGLSVELIGIMLGLLAQRFRKLPYKFVTAASWKNNVNKLYDLKALYKQVVIEPHRVDAALMGMYGLKISTGIDIQYNWNSIIKQLGAKE